MAATDQEQEDIIIVGKRNDDSKAVWDRNPLHPSNYGQPAGEVFISDMRPYEVQRSRGIQQKLGEKELQELGERAATQRRGAFDEAEAERARVRQEAIDARTEAGTFVAPGSVPVVGVTATPAMAAASSALAGDGSSGVTIPASEQHDAENPDGEESDEENTPNSGGTARVRRPRQTGSTPER